MLTDLLRSASLTWETRRSARLALSFAGCWPHDRELAEAATRHGFERPTPASVGETLLVAVSDDRRRTTLFRFDRRPTVDPLHWPQGAATRTALTQAEQFAPATLPLLTSVSPPRRSGSWELFRLFVDGEGDAVAVDGASFGLAMLLAVSSEWLGEPVPSDLVALAALDEHGRLARVAGLREKLAMVRGTALGVKRVLVAFEQKSEAVEHACGLDVIAVESATEALAVAFASLTERLRTQWNSTDEAQRAAEGMFRLALAPPKEHAIRWRAVTDASALLCEALPDGIARDKAAFAHAVAERHSGGTGHLPWPSERLLAKLPKVTRLRCIAHGVQAAADSGHLDARDRTREAMAQIEGLELSPETLELRGAIGRALAATGAYEDARGVLEAAVDGWFEIATIEGASYALCELLRVGGVLRDVGAVTASLRRVREFEAECSKQTLSIAFLRWMAGRALVQIGRPREALNELGGIETTISHPHVRAGVLRWRANAHQALGESAKADALRAQLASIDGVPAAAEFGALDAALASPDTSDEALSEPVERIAALRPQGIHGLLGPGTARERASRIVHEYPY